MTPEAIGELIGAARREQRRLRLHLCDGEVTVVRVLDWDGQELVYAPVSSSRPERYGVCDSSGFTVPLAAVARAQLLTG